VSDGALEQVVDMELAERSSEEIACAYRALCAAILLRTAMVARAKTPPRKVELDQKRTAIRWVAGGRGVITFESACEALDMAPDRARKSIGDYVRGGPGGAISNGKKPRSRMVTGGMYAPRPSTVVHGQNEIVPGVAACPPDAAPHRGCKAWP
jgi:hypothetical protein